jgi:uncharacterized glyoxalase superfamily protein PhnB
MSIMKLDMIGLTVEDLPKSISFYRLLGWEIPDPAPGEPYHEITLENGLRISWNSVEMMKQIEPHWKEPVGQRISLAYLCDSPSDVDNRYGEIVTAGYEGSKAPWDAFWGQRYAQVKDPDGNLVDLFCPLPS